MSVAEGPAWTNAEKRAWSRIVFHIDMDAFYASVEQRDNPSLKGKPVIVGGTGRRGVVSTASYEARKFGVHSAMPSFAAHQLCPEGIFLPGRMSTYIEVSKQIMAILDDYSPDVEPLSLDEAFLEMSGTEALLGPPEEVAVRLRDDILARLDLTASVGVARTKYVAKVCSDFKKPFGVTVCPPGTERAFLAPMPVRRLWGIGPKTEPRLRAYGLHTIGDVAARSLEELKGHLGSLGEHIWRLANGQDPRAVTSDRKAKSMGAERTLSENISGRVAIRKILLPLCDEVAARLRKAKVRAHGVRLKVKYADFSQHTRQLKLDEPICDARSLDTALERLYPKVDIERPMRLVGMAAFDMVPDDAHYQADLFGESRSADVVRDETKKHEGLEHVLDQVKAKFGDDAVKRASGTKTQEMSPSNHVRK